MSITIDALLEWVEPVGNLRLPAKEMGTPTGLGGRSMYWESWQNLPEGYSDRCIQDHDAGLGRKPCRVGSATRVQLFCAEGTTKRTNDTKMNATGPILFGPRFASLRRRFAKL